MASGVEIGAAPKVAFSRLGGIYQLSMGLDNKRCREQVDCLRQVHIRRIRLGDASSYYWPTNVRPEDRGLATAPSRGPQRGLILNDDSHPAVGRIFRMGRIPETLISEAPHLSNLIAAHPVLSHPAY